MHSLSYPAAVNALLGGSIVEHLERSVSFMIRARANLHEDDLRGRIDADLGIRKMEADLRLVRLREERRSK
jgi:hypothetical protein